ncbi:sugar phosphate isomerase/epimerase family protein [Paenibacillus thalictri]|uniref:Sugar phosphate isomerase/epimerase n=1 Tax=Paenibacillus thalictri TaxID=2527873 RepID=A0A4Q9DWG3_9BACL|nr:TIM barrel protein [Paenibacillus thalictri]TBL80172.1 sugar phosphate isomerase/epimerase [Paenibacillus thalictri]
MNDLTRVNNGTDRPPALETHQSWWGMIGIGENGVEWSMEQKLERIAAAGFTGILGRLPEPRDREQWHRLLSDYKLSFGIHSFPSSRADLESLLKEAKDFGVAYVNSQVMGNMLRDEAAVQLLQDLLGAAAETGIPYFVETHRGRITQDLLRTVDYVNQLPHLRLTIDISHYVLSCEVSSPSMAAELNPALDVLLQRTSSIHGRVSSGQQIQADIGEAEHPMASPFAAWWKQGMSCWLQGAQPGDVLPFVSELGPPPYAIVQGPDGTGPEISDRWQQALVLKRLAEQAWHEVTLQSGME